MNNTRTWLFRFLVIVAAGLMILSWFLPWYVAYAYGYFEVPNGVIIHPYGLELNLGEYAGYARGADMPVWFAPLMWVYLAICIIALISSMWLKHKEIKIGKRTLNLSSLLIGLVGFSYIVVGVLALIVAAIRTGDYFDMKLLEPCMIQEYPEVWVSGSFQLGYYLVYGVGILCLVTAFIRGRIESKQ